MRRQSNFLRRCAHVVCTCGLVAQPFAAAKAQEEPPPLDQLLVPRDTPMTAEQVALCLRQGGDLEATKTLLKEEREKLNKREMFVQLMRRELETMLQSLTDANKKAVVDLDRAYDEARKNLANATEAFNVGVKRHESAAKDFNRTCARRRFSSEAESAARRKEKVAPNLPRGPVTVGRPKPTAEEQREIDAYHNYLGEHIRTDRLKAEIKAHRRRNTVGKGSTTMQVILTISPAGKLTERGIKVSSGDPALDAIVLAAVDRAQPFTAPPKVIASTQIVWVLGFLGSPRR